MHRVSHTRETLAAADFYKNRNKFKLMQRTMHVRTFLFVLFIKIQMNIKENCRRNGNQDQNRLPKFNFFSKKR